VTEFNFSKNMPRASDDFHCSIKELSPISKSSSCREITKVEGLNAQGRLRLLSRELISDYWSSGT
jgi:hypothetical protein